jgi:hypothetical protein
VYSQLGDDLAAREYMRERMFCPTGGGDAATGTDLRITSKRTGKPLLIDVKTFDCAPNKKLVLVNGKKHESLRGIVHALPLHCRRGELACRLCRSTRTTRARQCVADQDIQGLRRPRASPRSRVLLRAYGNELLRTNALPIESYERSALWAATDDPSVRDDLVSEFTNLRAAFDGLPSRAAERWNG